MPDRIKLTEEDIEINIDDEYYFRESNVCVIVNHEGKTGEEIKQQILDDHEFRESHGDLINAIGLRNKLVVDPRLFHNLQEKADKYHDLMNANHEQIKENISLTETYQENKQLKERNQNLQERYDELK